MPARPTKRRLMRECREELGVDIMLGARVGRDWPIGEHGVLRVWLATIASGELTAHEHAALRWLDVDELHDVTWLPADVPSSASRAEFFVPATRLASFVGDKSHGSAIRRRVRVAGRRRAGDRGRASGRGCRLGEALSRSATPMPSMASLSRSPAVNVSGCSAPTALARPPRSVCSPPGSNRRAAAHSSMASM